MKIAIYSDIHLERQSFSPGSGAQTADVVVLAGDIGEGTTGLYWARDHFKNQSIVMVLGNHEFYGGRDFEAFVVEARSTAERLRIHLLENDAVTIQGVRFLGATMWTDFQLFDPPPQEFRRLKEAAQRSVKDYGPGQIVLAAVAADGLGAIGALDPDATIQRHWLSRRWLEQALAHGDPAKTVVVTHHCPSLQSIPPQFRSGAASVFSPTYASNLERIGGSCALWIHGHVHESADFDMGGTRVVCNPLGYNSLELGPQNPRFSNLLVEM